MSLKHAFRIAAAVLVLSASGCIPTMAKKDYLAQHLAPKASFDLDCPSEQLKFTDLSSTETLYFVLKEASFLSSPEQVKVEDMAKQQGVAGCGKRASFVWDKGSKQWLMNALGESQGTSGNQQAPSTTQQGSTEQL